MKNRIALFIYLVLSVSAGYSQAVQLTIEGNNGKFYLNHTVIAKENWYSIGRLFNLPPHDIANYNNQPFDKPLEVGTLLRIPLTATNFDQKAVKTSGESLIPVYHVVQEKEWMFKISSVYNDVPVTSLEKWNKIKRDDVKQGMTLIVGFLKVSTELSPLAKGISNNPVITANPADLSTKSAVKPTDIPANLPPGSTAASPSNAGAQTTAKTALVTTAANTSPSSATVIPVNNSSERVNNYAATHSNGGFFSTDYTGSGKTSSGMAGTFKSTSGWTDGKYYALMNSVPVGSIVRVAGANGKVIYAKVLGQLPEMKESTGLLIRISNAASAELGLGEGKFQVEVKY
jgi:hypothetical protein